ncbi:MAG: hypothetical protein Q7S21_03860 [archaeon]|nr:hypothetical protein [archaeon]
MVFKHFLLVASIILLGFNASALIVSNTPSSITFFEQTKELRFDVLNESDFEQALSIEFFSPIRYRIANSIPSNLLPGERTQVVLQLFPQKVTVNAEYKSTLYVTLGDETEKREIDLFFEANPKTLYQNQNTQSQNQNNSTQTISTSAFALLGANSAEFWINFILIIIAAVLLIAFIARMNRRM